MDICGDTLSNLIHRYLCNAVLVFKRLKSLLQLGSIPTKTEEAGEAWINGKILLSLLTEKYLGDIDFSPLGTSAANRSVWRETKLASFIIFVATLALLAVSCAPLYMARKTEVAFSYVPSVSLAFLIPSAAPSMMTSSFSSISFSIRSICFRRSLSPPSLSG